MNFFAAFPRCRSRGCSSRAADCAPLGGRAGASRARSGCSSAGCGTPSPAPTCTCRPTRKVRVRTTCQRTRLCSAYCSGSCPPATRPARFGRQRFAPMLGRCDALALLCVFPPGFWYVTMCVLAAQQYHRQDLTSRLTLNSCHMRDDRVSTPTLLACIVCADLDLCVC